jgi:uncharacterized protein (TIGR03437 family)
MVPLMVRFLVCLPLAAAAFGQPLTFGPLLSLPAQQAPLAITTADFNGDGIPDIAIANTGSSTISIFLGTGGGKFSSPTTASVSVQCKAAYLTAGNFTGAASPDLLAVCALGNFAVLPNTGHGTFGAPVSTNLPGPALVGNLLLGAIHPAIADFNGDGHLDLAIPTLSSFGSGGWCLMLGNGNGTFQNALPIPFSGDLSLSIAAGDFNGDGKPDLVTITLGVDVNDNATLSVEFLAGNGDGTFAAPTSVSVPTTVGTLILTADVNGDGNLDLLVAGSSLLSNITSLAGCDGGVGASGVTVFLGDGKGGFTMGFNATESAYVTGAALANALGSGNLDLIETPIQGDFFSGGTPTGAIEIRPGKGDGTFGNPIMLSFSSSIVPTDIAVADFNGDGRPDIALAAVPASGVALGSVSAATNFYSIISAAVAGLPDGDADVLLNTTVPPDVTFTDTNAASFAAGPIANGSIVSAFGSGLAESSAVATSLPLPTKLADASIAIKDSSGATTDAPLFYVSPKQINYAVPASIATGSATITITSNGSVFSATQQIVPVAPGLFSSPNRFAAGFTAVNVNGVVKLTPLVQNGALVPVDVSGGQTYLELFGTGIRNHAKPVVATIGSTNVTSAYAGAQGVFIGEDQINIQLPSSLQGSGEVALSLNADGQTSNTVVFLIK